MPQSKLKILLVDDDPVLIDLHSAILEKNDYSTLVAENGERAIQMLENFHENIGVVLSDVRMPGMDGYELCQWIKGNEITRNMPVIFVSALTSLEEKMQGYAAGADDYITKPVVENELCKKISVLLEIKQKQSLLNEQAAESRNMAMQAMTFSSELGQVIEFNKNVLDAADYAEIAKRYFDLVAGFNLVSILKIYAPGQVMNMSDSGIVSPLEVNVLELARDKGRFFDFGARTIVNYSTFSLLVKNMPLGDETKYGRIKDILAMLGNGLEAKIHQLNNEMIIEQKYSMIVSMKESIKNIETLFSDMQKDNISAIEDMNEQVREAILVMGLTEDQGEDIQQITKTCLERSNKAFYKGVDIEYNLKNIYQQFNVAIGVKN